MRRRAGPRMLRDTGDDDRPEPPTGTIACVRRETTGETVAEHSIHTAREGGETSRSRTLATVLRAAAALAVLAILWQGATAGGILMRTSSSLGLHEAGAVA